MTNKPVQFQDIDYQPRPKNLRNHHEKINNFILNANILYLYDILQGNRIKIIN